jgi:hypothetical protein
MKAYKHLVKHTLARGFTVSVFDGEDWDVKRSNKYQTIIDSIESVEEAQIRIRDTDGNNVGWALVIPGLNDDETVADYTCTDFMETWDTHYNSYEEAYYVAN